MSSSGHKRTQDNEPIKAGDDKRARTDTGDDVATSSTIEVRDMVRLPAPVTIASKASKVIDCLETIQGSNKEESHYGHPVIIGSRAASYWFPSYRACADWDIVATPRQAIDLIIYENQNKHLIIKLIKQPLDTNVIRRRPLPDNVKQRMSALPECLYKITGENQTTHLKFEIEIAANERESDELCSANQLLSMCNREQDDTRHCINFSLGASKGLSCIVASVEVLETLKSSHIYWPAHFSKHIADLHGLRALLAPHDPMDSAANYGFRADKNKPLTTPDRSSELNHFLAARTLEIEAFRGTPGAHINLNVSNQDFLGRDDDLFVDRHIPHDDVHALVQYGDCPVYDEMKTDKSKAMISQELFKNAPYIKQIQCVKEEAMVIALERFLLPNFTQDPTSAYQSALIRICTTLTKGWFRQFAVDNYPRLSVCDKELLPFRDAILAKHPLPLETKYDPLVLLRNRIANLEDMHIMERLESLTLESSKGAHEPPAPISSDEENSDDYDSDDESSSTYGDDDDVKRCRDNSQDDYESYERFWVINSAVPGNSGLLVSFANAFFLNGSDCIASHHFHATLSVQRLDANVDTKNINAFKFTRYDGIRNLPSQDFHKAAACVSASNEGGSWGGADIWCEEDFIARSLKEEAALIGIDGLNEDLLMAFIVAVVQPKLIGNGQTPLFNTINAYKSSGTIPVTPKNSVC
ncbi:hypothetical protein MBANPS3_012370 [Mucor bainieri]